MDDGLSTGRLCGGFRKAQLVDRRDGDFEIVGDEVLQLLAVHPAHDEDRRPQARAAQGDAFLDEGHAQLVDALGFEVSCHRHQAVAVGVRLDDAHHRLAGMPADAPQVLGEGIEIDADAGGALAGEVAHGAIVGGRHGELRAGKGRWPRALHAALSRLRPCPARSAISSSS